MKYQPVNAAMVEPALELVLYAYKEEKLTTAFLPDADFFSKTLGESLANLFARGIGIAAVADNKLAGFIAGIETGPFFGTSNGIYCPLYGHGAIKENRSAIYQGLYTQAAQLWVDRQCYSHAISLFAHDMEAIDTWFWLGFGMRCVDAIRRTETVTVNSSAEIRKLSQDDIPDLAELHREHNNYYNQSPIFMPREDEDPVADLQQWLERPNHHLWAAYVDGVPQGYMRFEPDGESFVSCHPKMMNNTGAYVARAARSAGLGSALLNEVMGWLRENDYPLCGVDYESINVSGSGFWNKHFTPYCFSVIRRIDERI